MKNNDFTIDFVGIGAGKSATSWISKCLAEHPAIDFSKVKETNFFLNKYFREGNSWYIKHFKNNDKKQGEYSPNYLYDQDAPKNIKKHSPNTKIIVCLRNPIEIIESAFSFEQFMGRGKEKSSRERFEKYFNRKSKAKGLYFKQLQKYFDEFPKEQILILIYEDIEKNPQKFIQHIYKFLEIDDNFIPNSLNSKVNITAPNKLRWPKIHRVMDKIRYKVSNSKNSKFWMFLIKKLKINDLGKFILKINKRKDKNLKSQIRKNLLTPKERKDLLNYYQEDIKKLEKILSRKLNFWV